MNHNDKIIHHSNTLLKSYDEPIKHRILKTIKHMLKDESSSIFQLSHTDHPSDERISALLKQEITTLQKKMKNKHLTKEEQHHLFYQWQKYNDQKAMATLIEAFYPMIRNLAHKSARQSGVPLEDLINEARLAAYQSIQKFDPTKGYAISTFILRPIQGAMARYVMDMSGSCRIGSNISDIRIWRHYNHTAHDLSKELKRPITQDDYPEIAKRIGVDIHHLERMLPRIQRQDVLLSTPLKHGDTDNGHVMTYEDILQGQEDTSYTQEFESRDLEKAMLIIEKTIQSFPTRQQDIIRKRLLNDQPTHFHTLAAQYNVSRERIRQIEVKSLKKIRAALEESGISTQHLFH